MRSLLTVGLLCLLPSGVGAQYRPTTPVAELSEASLSGMLSSARSVVSGCATRVDARAYLADVRVTVRPGPRPSTMFNARVRVSVRSRPRHRAFERCVSTQMRGSLRGQAFAVPRTVRAHRTFQVSDRPPPPLPRPRVSFSEAEARGALRQANARLARCIDAAGPGEPITLHVVVDRAGRMVLQNASLPPRSSPRSLQCLSRTISRLQLRGHPQRRVRLTHAVPVRSRAW